MYISFNIPLLHAQWSCEGLETGGPNVITGLEKKQESVQSEQERWHHETEETQALLALETEEGCEPRNWAALRTRKGKKVDFS